MNGTATRSPIENVVTPSPRDAITPLSSCPGVKGRPWSSMSLSWPLQPCQSLRQTPVARTSMTTPPGGATGTGTSSTRIGPPNSWYTLRSGTQAASARSELAGRRSRAAGSWLLGSGLEPVCGVRGESLTLPSSSRQPQPPRKRVWVPSSDCSGRTSCAN
eukprot:COSAG06_NODE_1052_length_10949_cov_42.211797_12_plen_160_part_00